MIRALVDFALNNKFVVLAIAVLLLAWGAISFHNLPVEAYPDIADNYVTVITQWAGRSAEEVEQQITIPIEIQMSGMPHMTFLRSESIFGLSFRSLRDRHYAMGGAFCGRGRAANHDSNRNTNVRNAAHDLSALRVYFRPVVRDHDLRRQFRERLEPAEGAGKAHPGQSPAWTKPSTSDRHRLERHGPDLLVHPEKHKSPIRPDGIEVD